MLSEQLTHNNDGKHHNAQIYKWAEQIVPNEVE